MDEDRPDDPARSPDGPRPRRAPPTIDLEASEVTEKTDGGGSHTNHDANHDAGPRHGGKPRFAWPPMAAISPLLVAGLTGAVTAALVIALAWALGWPGDSAQPIAKAETNAGAIETLSSRVTELEVGQRSSPRRHRIRRKRQSSMRWKNPSPRCGVKSPASAPDRKSFHPTSMQ